MQQSWQKDAYTLSTDPDRLDLERVCAFLASSYWARGIPLEVLREACAHSLCLGIYRDGEQIGFGRVITDRATFGYLADVYVEEPHRGHGLAAWLVDCVLAHPELRGFRRWMLATLDAHALYEKAGFRRLANPERFMEITDPEVYVRGTGPAPLLR